MNSMLKEKLDFVIRVVKEHGYKIKILKNKEKPIEVEKIISVSPPKCIDDKNMLTFHKYIKNMGFSCLSLGENHNTTEHYIKQIWGVETDCPVCYSTLDESKVWCQTCRAIFCVKCSEQLARCPICQNEEWTIKHRIDEQLSFHAEFCSKALSGNEVCTLLYADEYREEYEHFTGEDTRNTRYSAYTTNEQISRYSKRLAFWKIKLNELGEHPEFYTQDGITSYTYKRMLFMGNLDRVRVRMENNFTNEIKTKIREAAYKLEVAARTNI